MKAVRVGGRRGPARIEEIEAPTPAEGQALVRMSRATIGEDDVITAMEMRESDPVTMGREGVGTVESVGEGVDGSLVGTRVTFEPAIPCGACDLCKKGLSAHCASRQSLGDHPGIDGCFAEYVAMPASLLVRVPDGVDDDRAVHARLFSIARHASMRVRIEGRPYITILGDSQKALAIGQVMSKLNAQVRVIGWQEASLAQCEKWGIRHRHASEPGLHEDQDVVVDCSGGVDAIELAMAMIRPRGTVLATMPRGLSLHASTVVGKELDVLGTTGGSVAEGLAMLAEDTYETTGLVSKRVALADAVKGLHAMFENEIGVAIEC